MPRDSARLVAVVQPTAHEGTPASDCVLRTCGHALGESSEPVQCEQEQQAFRVISPELDGVLERALAPHGLKDLGCVWGRQPTRVRSRVDPETSRVWCGLDHA